MQSNSSWQYRTAVNEHGQQQVFDYSQCPAVAVCSECHVPYTNVIGREACCDCYGDAEPVEKGQTTTKLENKYGFIDHVLVENGELTRFTNGDPMPVCPSCFCHVMPNRSGGSGICDSCEHDFNVHCAADYDELNSTPEGLDLNRCPDLNQGKEPVSVIVEVPSSSHSALRSADFMSHFKAHIPNFKNDDGSECKNSAAAVSVKYLNLKPGTRIKITIEEIK